MTQQAAESRYWAFISYSRHDAAAAKWLHRAIENYRVPPHLVKQGHITPVGEPAPERFRPVFRDRDELPASPNLGDEIQEALSASRYLIIVASPHAARSKWVSREVAWFVKLGRASHIFALIVDGEPNTFDGRECFPAPLKHPLEPLAPDIRPHADGKENAKLKLIAGMLGVGFDDLKQREAQSRLRRIQSILALAVLAIVLLGGLLWYANDQRLRAVEAGSLARARELAALSAVTLREEPQSRLDPSGLLAVESLRRYPTIEGDQAGRAVLALLPRPPTVSIPGRGTAWGFSPDGTLVLADGEVYDVRVSDAGTGVKIASTHHDSHVVSAMFDPTGERVVSGAQAGAIHVWQSHSGHRTAQMVHPETLEAVALSPDGKWVASTGRGQTVLWDADTGTEVWRGPNPEIEDPDQSIKPAILLFSPDGRWLAASVQSKSIRVRDVTTGALVVDLTDRYRVESAAFAPDGSLIVGSTYAVSAWDLPAGSKRLELEQMGPWVSVAVSPDGRRIASGDYHGLQVWDSPTGREVFRLTARSRVYDMEFSPDGKRIAGLAFTSRIWDAETGAELTRLDGGYVHFSPDGKRIVTGGNEIRVWSAEAGAEDARLGSDDRFERVAYSPARGLIAASERAPSGTISDVSVWDLAAETLLSRVTVPNLVTALEFSPDGGRLAALHWSHENAADGGVIVWEVAGGRELARFAGGSPRQLPALAWAPDGGRLLTVGADQAVRVLDVATGRELSNMTHSHDVTALAFSPDGARVASGSSADVSSDGPSEGEVRIWDPASGQLLSRMDKQGIVKTLAFSPDARYVAVLSGLLGSDPGDELGGIRVWEAASGRLVADVPDGIEVFAFAPDGRRMAFGSYAGDDEPVLVVRELPSGRVALEQRRSARVDGVAYSADGRSLLIIDSNGATHVLDAVTGRAIARSEDDSSAGTVSFGNKAAAFTPDGSTVITVGRDRVVRAWKWRPEDVMATLCARLSANFTGQEWALYLGDEPCRATCSNLPDICTSKQSE